MRKAIFRDGYGGKLFGKMKPRNYLTGTFNGEAIDSFLNFTSIRTICLCGE